MRALVLLIVALLFGGSAWSAEFSSLEERMSDAEFKSAGLDKLSDEELSRLNQWIRSQLMDSANASAPTAPSSDLRGFASDETDLMIKNTPDNVVSRIDGAFSGWSNGTSFRLKNGQVWKAVENTNFSPREKSLNNPQVSIKRSILGNSWILKVEGYNSSVRVKRVE